MKNILVITALFCAFALQAQERTVDLKGNTTLNLLNQKVVAYVGGVNDRLIPTTRDTIDYYVILSNWEPGPIHFYAVFQFDTIAGADTTIAITVQEKKANNQAYTDVIASATTSAITAETLVVKTSLGTINAVDTTGYKYYTSDKPNTLLYYKYLKFRLILQGNDSVGTGIKVERIDLSFYQ